MLCKTFLNISKNGKLLMPSVQTRVLRCYASNNNAQGAKDANNCEEKKDKTDRFALHKELEKAINEQINKELQAGFAHLAMAEYYKRKNVGLPGFAQKHTSCIYAEIRQAKELIAILSQRGANLTLKAIEPPKSQDWKGPLEVEKFAVQSEKTTAEGLMDLLNMATKYQDHHVSNIVGSTLMGDAMRIVAELEQRAGKIEACPKPECLSNIDNALLKEKKIKPPK